MSAKATCSTVLLAQHENANIFFFIKKDKRREKTKDLSVGVMQEENYSIQCIQVYSIAFVFLSFLSASSHLRVSNKHNQTSVPPITSSPPSPDPFSTTNLYSSLPT